MRSPLLLAHCLSSYALLGAAVVAKWVQEPGFAPADLVRAGAVVAAAPFIVPLESTLGLWNRYGVRTFNAVLLCSHVVLTTGLYLLIRWRRARRAVTAGHCAGCGYDLTGNVSGVCPECGTPTAAKA